VHHALAHGGGGAGPRTAVEGRAGGGHGAIHVVRPASAIVVSLDPSMGEVTGSVAPVAAGSQRLAMNSACRGTGRAASASI
jgi:hypothetical protein